MKNKGQWANTLKVPTLTGSGKMVCYILNCSAFLKNSLKKTTTPIQSGGFQLLRLGRMTSRPLGSVRVLASPRCVTPALAKQAGCPERPRTAWF